MTPLPQPWHSSDAVTRRRAIALTRRSRGDGGCRTAPLAGYRLAPRRREITFGRQSETSISSGENTDAIVRAREGEPTAERSLGVPSVICPSLLIMPPVRQPIMVRLPEFDRARGGFRSGLTSLADFRVQDFGEAVLVEPAEGAGSVRPYFSLHRLCDAHADLS